MYNSATVEVLTQAAYLELLRDGSLGRLEFQDRLLLAVHPVPYFCDGGSFVFRTTSGGKLHAAVRHGIVALEIEHIDPASGHGWSVIASGHAEPVTDPYELDRVNRASRHRGHPPMPATPYE